MAASIARMPGTYTFEVLFDAPLEMMKEIVPPTMIILEASKFETLVRECVVPGHGFALGNSLQNQGESFAFVPICSQMT